MDRDNVFTYSLFLLLSLNFTIIVGGGGQQQQPLLLSQKVKGEEKPLPPIPSLAKPKPARIPYPIWFRTT